MVDHVQRAAHCHRSPSRQQAQQLPQQQQQLQQQQQSCVNHNNTTNVFRKLNNVGVVCMAKSKLKQPNSIFVVAPVPLLIALKLVTTLFKNQIESIFFFFVLLLIVFKLQSIDSICVDETQSVLASANNTCGQLCENNECLPASALVESMQAIDNSASGAFYEQFELWHWLVAGGGLCCLVTLLIVGIVCGVRRSRQSDDEWQSDGYASQHSVAMTTPVAVASFASARESPSSWGAADDVAWGSSPVAPPPQNQPLYY
jgi:hypothetical protein